LILSKILEPPLCHEMSSVIPRTDDSNFYFILNLFYITCNIFVDSLNKDVYHMTNIHQCDKC
jgi:hypothetical protein